jgi:type VI secretion system protein ImpH
MGRLKDQPQRFSFDAAVRVLTFLRRRADPAAAARFTSTTGSSYLPAEVTQVQVDAGIAEPLVTVGG